MSVVRLSLLLLLVGTVPSVAWGQTSAADTVGTVPDTLVHRVATAFQTGNAQLLLAPAADRVEVSLFGARTFYSSAQAFYVLRDFFEKHPPSRFVLADTTGAGRSGFLRGTYRHTRGAQPLKVYLRFVHERKDAWALHEVRIDAESE
jgi:hypothetical protein